MKRRAFLRLLVGIPVVAGLGGGRSWGRICVVQAG